MIDHENGAVKILVDIRRGLTSITRATVVLYLALALFGGVAWWIRSNDLRHVNLIATTNQVALCAFRNDVAGRVSASQQFLEEHPNGIPGISPAMIRSNLAAQQQTVESLSILACPETGG